MSEETSPEESYYETYAERVQKVREEKATKPNERFARRFKMSDQQAEFAQVLMRLSENDDFKKYLEFENSEIADLYVNPYREPRDKTMESASFSEKMAFNKGCLFQMNYLRNGRDWLLKTYLEQLKNQKRKEATNGQN